MNGPMDSILERLPSTKARNAALDEMLKTATEAVAAEQQRDEAIHSTARMIADGVAHLINRMDAFEAKREAEAKAAAEQAEREEQQQIQSYLDQLPNPDSPTLEIDATYSPGGELHTVAPVDKEHFDPEAQQTEADASPVKPALSYGNVPMSYIKGKKDQTGDLPEGLEKRAPPSIGNYPTYDPAELSYPAPRNAKQVPQPVSVSLNEDN